MKVFKEYLTEAKQVKSLKNYVGGIYEDLKSLKGFNVHKPDFMDFDFEKAEIVLTDNLEYKGKEFYNYAKDNKQAEIAYEKLEKTGKSLFFILTGKNNLPKKHLNYKYKNNYLSVFYEFPEVEIKDELKVKLISYLTRHEGIVHKITFTGKKAKESEKTFDKHQKFDVGTIVYTSYGYSMTLTEFYEIVKRVGSTIYLKEIASKTVSGDTGYSGESVPVKGKFVDNEEVFKVRIGTSGYPKIDGKQLFVWSGKPVYFNKMD